MSMWGPCPDLKFKYKNEKSSVWYHTPGVMDGGRSLHGHLEEDGYFYIYLGETTFGGEITEDVIRFKPQKDKEYKVYMDPRIDNRIYIDTTYERVRYIPQLKGYSVLETCEG